MLYDGSRKYLIYKKFDNYKPIYYWVPARKYKIYKKVNPDILYETEETVISYPDDKYYILAYSGNDPQKLVPVLTKRVIIKNKWGQPIYITGIDSKGRIWKEEIDSHKRWYICDSCGRGFSRLNNVGHNLWLCDECYVEKDYSGAARDRWLMLYGLW